MPIFTYKCTGCGTECDELQKPSEAPLTTCPVCEKETYVKQLAAPGFTLKGTGWYATDFKNSGSGVSNE